jgi:hypothetical protein
MAIFYMQISSISRSAGRRATAAAAYRAGERIRDERSGELHNYSRRRDVLHTEIFLPQQYAEAPIAWARNRESLWNSVEHAEKRYNARLAREFQVNLPAELTALERVALARSFARDLSERYKVAVDLAVHAPRPEGDPRNFHAHLLATTREVTPTGLGVRAGLDMHARERRQRELPDHRQEFVNVRARWASLTNEALRAANIAARIDHRSLAAQGAEREPAPAIPIMHLKMEQRGLRSAYAERLRAQYGERVAGRLTRQSVAVQEAPEPPRELAEIRRQAREAWLAMRSQEARGASTAPALESEPRAQEDDLAR